MLSTLRAAAFTAALTGCVGSALGPVSPAEPTGRGGTLPSTAGTPDDPVAPDPVDTADGTTPSTPTTTPGGRCWSEPLEPDAAVDDVERGFRSATARDDALEVLDRRWPAGSALLREMAHDPYVDVFLEEGSWVAMMDSLMTVVHEETHGWDYEHAIHPTRFSYFVQADEHLETAWIDGFPRSRIRDRVEGDATDLYADLYLTGTQGTYGFSELLDETNAYVLGLGGALAGADALPWTTSAADGPLAFLYYVALYLEEARDEDPSLFARLQDDPDVRALLETLWLRTHFLLEEADRNPALGIEDERIRALLYAHQEVWEEVLGAPLAASPCLP